MVTRVKICGLTRAEDVLAAVHAGADAVGFVLEPSSPRCVAWETADTFSVLTGPYCTSVAVYGKAKGPFPKTRAVQAVEFLDRPGHQEAVLALRLKPGEQWAASLKEWREWSAIVLDAYSPDQYGGTGKRIDWDSAAEVIQAAPVPVILAGGLTPDNVAEAIQRVRPYGVDVSSGVESALGVKDWAMIRDFIAAAREA